MKKTFYLCLCGLSCMCINLSASDPNNPNTNPWLLNVYAIDDIGTSANPYGSDFEGSAGSGSDSYFSGFSLNANGTASSSSPYAFYGGGSLTFTNGSTTAGGVQAGTLPTSQNPSPSNTVTLTNSTINGNVSGNNLSITGGQINGTATYSGTSQVSNNSIQPTQQAYTPFLNQTAVANYFKSASAYWNGVNAQTITSTQASAAYGNINLGNLANGRNVYDISLATWNSLYTITANNDPSGAYIIFNITDNPGVGSDSFKAVTINGINMDQVLVNLSNAQNLALSGGTYSSILAPDATITFSSGVLQGNLVALNLLGSGQVDINNGTGDGAFTGFAADQGNFMGAPEPITYALLGSMLSLVVYIKSKATKNSKVVA